MTGCNESLVNENQKAFLVHFFGHALNLTVGDLIKNTLLKRYF